MNTQLFQILLKKDWDLWRSLIFLYGVGGLVGVALIALPQSFGFYAGSVLLITILIGCGMHLIYLSVINERKLKTLPFVMSLPISIRDFTASKIGINLLIFSVVWLALTLGCVGVTLYRDTLPNGLLPFITIVLLELYTAYCLILGVSILTESEGWTIGTMAVCNLFLNLFIYLVARNDSIRPYIGSNQPNWNGPTLSIIGLEIALAVVFIVLTFHLQSKKRDFI